MFDKFSFFPDSPQVRYLVTGSESGSESESESEFESESESDSDSDKVNQTKFNLVKVVKLNQTKLKTKPNSTGL